MRDVSVFLDFDGTITTVDTGVHLLDRLVGDTWLDIERLYESGQIGSRECMTRQWALLATFDEGTLRATAREVPVDPGFEPLVRALLGAGAEVAVVSDGYGFYAREVCEPLGLPVLANDVDWATGRVTFGPLDPSCPCRACGTCKRAPLLEARRRGRRTVLVGDGTSDRKGAEVADRLFAKEELARWCDGAGVAYTRFACLSDVHAALFAEGLC